jgi:TPR repeat protein
VHEALSKLRSGEAAMRKKWLEDEDHWHKLPPRAWPAVQPKAEERAELEAKAKGGSKEALFDLATCLTFTGLDPVEGLRRYRELAAGGSLDAMVAVSIILLEGIGRDLDDASVAEGVRLLKSASERGHAQAKYELACLHYLGSFEEVVPEDERAAYALFAAAAAQKHTPALFMQAELLIDGHGTPRDEARAVPLLHAAAQGGHRMARAYVRDYLDADARAYAADTSPMARAQTHAERLPELPPDGSQHFSVWRGDGSRASMPELLDAAAQCDVVLLGECHDDPVAHSLEAYVLVSLAARRPKVTTSPDPHSPSPHDSQR